MLFLEFCYSEILLTGKTQPCERTQHKKRYQQTQAQNATTNGGDASRVGHEGKGSQTGA